MIMIGPSPGKGRGVFATRLIETGELIEQAPVIVVPTGQWEAMHKTVLFNYYFAWGEHSAIALGYGSLYNHAYQPNARFVKQLAEERIDFFALHPIQPGEEILINYNGDPNDDSPLWFHPLPPNP
ncbi:MAG TPA: SET domain-containing protein [Caldilineaceae bacterium]|nr:SET domain-containing protein [Caldilineaceae bacterium]